MLDYGNYAEIVAQLRVISHEGSGGSLDVVVQHSVDEGETWADLKGFDQVTTEDGVQQISMSRWDFTGPLFFGNRLRVKWTVGGDSPSFTFRVDWVLKG
jgi:hypothetical protein